MIVTLHGTLLGKIAYDTGTPEFQQVIRVFFAEQVSPGCVAFSGTPCLGPTIATRELRFRYSHVVDGVPHYFPL